MKRKAAAIFIVVFATIGCQAVPEHQSSHAADDSEIYDNNWENTMDPSNPDVDL